jgi:hypothetical protein
MHNSTLRRPYPVEGIEKRITKVIDDIFNLMQVLDVILHYLGQTDPLTEAKRNTC